MKKSPGSAVVLVKSSTNERGQGSGGQAGGASSDRRSQYLRLKISDANTSEDVTLEVGNVNLTVTINGMVTALGC